VGRARHRANMMIMGVTGPVFSENGTQNHMLVMPQSSGPGGSSRMSSPPPENEEVLKDYYVERKPAAETQDIREIVKYVNRRMKEEDDEYLLGWIKSNQEIGIFTLAYSLTQLNGRIKAVHNNQPKRFIAGAGDRLAGDRFNMTYLPWVVWPALLATLAVQLFLPFLLTVTVHLVFQSSLQDDASALSSLSGICVFKEQTEKFQDRAIMACVAVIFMARCAVMAYVKRVNVLSKSDADDASHENMNNLLRMCYKESPFEVPSGRQLKLSKGIFWFMWIDFVMDSFYEPIVYLLNLWLVFLTSKPIEMVSTVCVCVLVASIVHAMPRVRP
jgi:preprotein translocase subunit SecG